jgi:general secretion pathway protein J
VKPDSVDTPASGACDQTIGDRGFTLVEVMVALTILSLVMMATVTGLRTLGNTQGTIERMTNRVDEIRSVSSFLRDLLESAVVGEDLGGFSLGGGNSEATYFVWGDDFLALESTVLFGERYGGSYIVRVAKENSQLVLRWQERPANGTPEDWTDMPSRVMVENLEGFSLATRSEFGEDWSNPDGREGLPVPALVRLQMKAAGRHWPDLILQVQR